MLYIWHQINQYKSKGRCINCAFKSCQKDHIYKLNAHEQHLKVELETKLYLARFSEFRVILVRKYIGCNGQSVCIDGTIFLINVLFISFEMVFLIYNATI